MLEQIEEKYFIEKKKKTGGIQKVWKVKVKCICGVIKDIGWQEFNTGRTVSCGCLSREKAKERMKKSNTKYKNTDHPLYETFKSMKKRAYNKSFSSYLGNGCIEEWKDYNKFYEWAIQHWFTGAVMRIFNKEKPFSPENCYFTTKSIVQKENSNKGLAKRKQTCIEKYGEDNYLKTKEGKEKISKSRKGKGIIHGKSKTRIWNIWRRMIKKCENSNYHRYEKGLTYFEDWKDFNTFEKWCLDNDYDKKLKFERKDITKGFYPNNCIFTNASESRKKYEEKAKQTNLEKYGVEYLWQDPIKFEEHKNKMIELYGQATPKSGSKAQDEIYSFLKDLGFEFISNTEILEGKEIDLYNEDLKIGIEYCGIYWHTELNGRKYSYHKDKWKKCKDQNIELITIFSDEWIYNKNKVKSFLKSKLGIYNETIYARKCIVKEITKEEGNFFIERYHLQGKKNSIKYFGLFYNNNLVGCMSFSKHHRNSQELILDRLCFKEGIKIIGGASKLFKLAVSWAKEEYDYIKTWSDNRWSTGKVYSKIGFVFDGNLNPDYSYVNLNSAGKRHSKQSMKKSLINCPDNVTELEHTISLGYSRIWDCGKKRWIYKL